MPVHMIRLQTAPNASLRQWVTTWLTNMTAWSEADNQPPTDRETADGTPYMSADWRFAWGANSKEVLLANLVAYARSYTSWGVIGWHECYHDSDNPDPCSMSYGLDGGFAANIQSGVWGGPPASIDPRD